MRLLIDTNVLIYAEDDEIIRSDIADLNAIALKHNIEPQVLYLLRDPNSQEMKDYGVILINIKGGEVDKTISYVNDIWDKFNPSFPFEFQFLDTAVEQLYQIENKASILFNYFTFLSIFIACLGLLGLISFTTEQRIKEISIRKVLGASVVGIVIMLLKNITKLVLISNLIAWPVAYFAMSKWLQNFAYRISIEWWIFALAGVAALFIALLTVSWQAVRAATANPVEALKWE